jgi:DNA-binding Xre family transcriptional regulator
MPIRVNLDIVLVQRGLKLSELAEAIDITLPNLSILKTKVIYLSTFLTER